MTRRVKAEEDLLQSNWELQHEIGERIQADKALRDSESLYHSLVDNLPIYVTRIGLDGRITYVNENYCRLIGLAREEILGKTNYDFGPEELAGNTRRTNVGWPKPAKFSVRSNRIAWVTQSGITKSGNLPCVMERGKYCGNSAVFWDVTERHEAEFQRLRAEAALRTAKEEAESANRAKSEFLANIKGTK